MKSTLENPLAFFNEYFNSGIKKDLIQYEIEKQEAKEHANFFSGDNISSDIKTKPFKDSDFFTVEEFIFRQTKKEIAISKNLIEQGFERRFSNNSEILSYSKFLRLKLKQLTELNNSTYLKLIVKEFENFINYYNININTYQSIYSLNLIAKTSLIQKNKIFKLYDLLTESPALINSSKEDFERAFTGKELKHKVVWLPISKRNKKPSKTSLLYFLDQLIDSNYLAKSVIHDLYKFIRYIFTDANGDELKNLKQTRQNMSENPDFKERIDLIITSL